MYACIFVDITFLKLIFQYLYPKIPNYGRIF